MERKVIELTPEMKLFLHKRQCMYLTSQKARILYAGQEFMLAGPSMHLRHTGCAEYKPVSKRGVLLGVEAEMELHAVDYLDTKELQNLLAASIRHELIKLGWGWGFSIQRDATVKHGFEMVFAPANISLLVKTFHKVLKNTGLETFICTNNQTGLHITVDPIKDEKRALQFYRVFNDSAVLRKLTNFIGREPNAYCELRKVKTWDEAVRQPRYSAVNVRDNGAMEVRLFRFTGDATITDYQLSLVESIYKACTRKEFHSVDEVIRRARRLQSIFTAWEKNA